MNKFTASLSLAALLLGAAHATDLRIYQNFAEVRTPISASTTTFTVDLPDNVWGGIVAGSLDLEGLPYTQAVQQRQSSWLRSQEGRTVTLREDGDSKTQTVTLVRAADLLVKDAAGQYRTVRFEQLGFEGLPPVNAQNPTQSMSYSLEHAGQGTLTYLTRQISWTPRYTLRASGSAATLSAQADIRNESEQSYNITATELFSGEVNLESADYPMPVMYNMKAQATAAAAPVMPAPRVGAMNSVGGLYRYGLSSAFTLPASSTYTLPFAAPKLSSFERYAGLDTYFSTQKQDGTLNRSYRLKADQNLPAGQLTVREDGRITGQTSIAATAKGDPIEFSLGRDPDIKYTRSIETLQTTKTGGSYKVTYTFESSKDRVTRAEVSEHIGGRKVSINGAPKANQNAYEFKVDVPAHGKASKTFTVNIDNS